VPKNKIETRKSSGEARIAGVLSKMLLPFSIAGITVILKSFAGERSNNLLALFVIERDLTHVYRSYLRDDSRGICDRSEVPWYLREPFQRIRIKTTIKETTS
jgi:hypothetical protein